MTNAAEQIETCDFAAIKSKQNATWASGDYSQIGVRLQIVGESLAEAIDMAPGSHVLDVAAGDGNVTLALARRFYDVTSTDYVGDLLARGRARAESEGFDINFQIADVEALPFEDASFDAVVSTYGVMFAPNQDQAARELQRVVRADGRIGLANWTPDGFIGQLFKTLGRHVPPPAGVQSPARWGDDTWIKQTFAPACNNISIEKKHYNFRYLSPQHFVDFFRTYYGPVHKAFLALEPNAQAALEADILQTISTFNTATDGTMIVPSDYLEIIITK